MGSSSAVTGLDELAASLAALQRALSPALLQADALAAVQPMLADAQATIPSRTGKTKHLLHAVARASSHGATATVEVANSGPGRPGHDAIFLEYGTANMAAQPFLRPAFYRRETEALRIVTQRLVQRIPQR